MAAAANEFFVLRWGSPFSHSAQLTNQSRTCKHRNRLDAEGDYLIAVKDNQPELKAAIEAELQPGPISL